MVPPETVSAIRCDDVESLKQWLASGGSPGAVTAEGDSLLSLAARHGALGVVDLLLREGTPPDAFGIWPNALIQAVEAGHEPVVRRLLEAGADVGSEPWHEDADLPLLSAVEGGHWNLARLLLNAGAAEKAAPRWLDEVLETALKARSKGRTEVVRDLIERLLARFADAPLPIQDRVLKEAATSLRRDSASRPLAEQLMARIDTTRAKQQELIHLLTEQNCPDAAVSQVKEAQPEWRRELAAVLLPHAARQGKWEHVEQLMRLAEGDIERCDRLGRTTLMYAAKKGKRELISRLIELGADLRSVDHTDQSSVIDWARLGHHPEGIRYLEEELRRTAPAIDAAADAHLATLDAQERKTEAARIAVEAALEGRWDRVEELLTKGTDVNGRGRNGQTLLMEAFRQSDRRRIEWLVALGASLDAKDDAGHRMFVWANMADASEDMLRLLDELETGRLQS